MLKMVFKYEMIGVNVDLKNNHPLGSLVKFYILDFGPHVLEFLIV